MPVDTRLVIASNRLPFSVRQSGDELVLEPTAGGLAAALASVHQTRENVWIGWPGNYASLTERQRVALSLRLQRERVVPVNLSGSEIGVYYDGICNGVLWPTLHYLVDRVPLTFPDFRMYRAVNERFARAIIDTYRPGDLVWVHDYHLMLVPAMIRSRIPDARIGFFLHTPFPAGDVFRILPWRRELLDGVLGSTLIGFQTERDAGNFGGAVRQLTEYGVDGSSVIADEREVTFGVYPIGIDPRRLQTPAEEGIEESHAVLGRRLDGRKLLVGVDRLDYTKGIRRRLVAFERMLSESPELHGRVELLQVAVPSRSHVPAYISFKEEVEDLVDRINRQFGTRDWTPVRYAPRSISLPALAAVYQAADVMLVTSLRDGMNLVAKEFVASRADEDGVLILSEMTGAAEELSDALLVNPYSVEQLASAMATALAFDRDERRRRMKSMRQQVSEWTVDRWVWQFTSDLDLSASVRPSSVERVTGTIRALMTKAPQLSLAFVYEDSLIGGPVPVAQACPDPELLDLLRELAARDRLDVHIISNFDRDTLDGWFETVPATLWAQHGLWRRERDGQRWRRTQWIDTDWTPDVRQLLDQFTSRTPGAFVEEHATGLAWHFDRADGVTGRAQAQTLRTLLNDAASAMGFSVSASDTTIDVLPAGLSLPHTLKKLRDIVSTSARLVVVGRCGECTSNRVVLRHADLLVNVGGSPAIGGFTLADRYQVRELLRGLATSVPSDRRTAPQFRAVGTRLLAGAAVPGLRRAAE